jgi:hypothetical protein
MLTTTGHPGVNRALRFLLTFGTLAVIASWSAVADAKAKGHKLKMDPAVPETPEPTGPVPPEADANGHVNFGNPQAEGIGRVTVTSSKGDKIQVYLEGRYFGDTPVTIYSVPKGDYIVEGTIPSSGKQISKPVSVSENEEATVELGAAKAPDATAEAGGAASGDFWSSEMTPKRKMATYISAGVAGAGIIMAVTFAILEKGAESDYEKAPAGNQANVDAIAARGRRDAALTDVGLVLAGVGVAGAIVFGYPLVIKPKAEKTPQPIPTAMVAPILAPGVAGAGFSMRF